MLKDDIKYYIEKNKKILFYSIVFSCICFGFMLTHHMVLIDEEFHYNTQSRPELFLAAQRFTNYLLGKVYANGRIIPFFTDFSSIVLWNISGFIFGLCFFKENHSPLSRFIALSYFSTVPFCVGEIFAFSEIILSVSIAMLLTSIAFWLTIHPFGGVIDRAAIVLLLTLAIGSYQAFICVYITAIMAKCCLNHWNKEKFFGIMIKGTVLCIMAIGLYFLINFFISAESGMPGYLSNNYIGWFSEDNVLKAAFMAFANVIRVSFAIKIQDEIIYGGLPIMILTTIFCIISVIRIIHAKGFIEKIKCVMLSALFVMAPFSLYIALGTYKTHGRVMLALSLSGMIELLCLFDYIKPDHVRVNNKRSVLIVIAYILTIWMLLSNASNMNMIYYSAYQAYEYDCTLADSIINDVNKITSDSTPKTLVTIGSCEPEIEIEPKNVTLGASFFSWDGGAIHRIKAFMELRGKLFNSATSDDIIDALEYLAHNDMPSYPEEGSVVLLGDMVIVYLGEPSDKWYQTNLPGYNVDQNIKP